MDGKIDDVRALFLSALTRSYILELCTHHSE